MEFGPYFAGSWTVGAGPLRGFDLIGISGGRPAVVDLWGKTWSLAELCPPCHLRTRTWTPEDFFLALASAVDLLSV